MLTFDDSQARVGPKELDELLSRLEPEIEQLRRVVKNGGYENDRASANLPSDTAMIERVKELAKPFEGADSICLVGMGGPGLGAKAVQEAITGIHHNYLKSPRVFYLDTLNPTRATALMSILDAELAAKKRVVVIISSQSGTTLESISNFESVLELLTQHALDPVAHVPIITNQGTKFETWASQRGHTVVSVPPKVGGRYSVLSPVGLFPLHLMGIDIKGLVTGARRYRDDALTKGTEHSATCSAAIRYYHLQNGRNVSVHFLFAPELEGLGLWVRQLMAESLGKKKLGPTPTVAIGSRDLHSMFQLYIAGPDDKFTTFVSVHQEPELRLGTSPEFEELVANIQAKTYNQISQAILRGVYDAYQQQYRPYVTIELADAGAESIGAFLQHSMLETMYLAHLLRVNPFDQPSVEIYKGVTKAVLAGKENTI